MSVTDKRYSIEDILQLFVEPGFKYFLDGPLSYYMYDGRGNKEDVVKELTDILDKVTKE